MSREGGLFRKGRPGIRRQAGKPILQCWSRVIDLSGYFFESLRKDQDFILYRGQSKAVASPVLVLFPAVQHPTPESLKRLEHE